MNYIDEILNNYDTSFVNDYDKWKDIIDNINNYIPVYLESIKVKNKNIDEFTYNEFCIIFRKEIQNYLSDRENLSPEGVHDVLDIIVRNRIISSLSDADYSKIKKLLK